MSELFKPLDPSVPEARAPDMSILSIQLNHVPISEPTTEAREQAMVIVQAWVSCPSQIWWFGLRDSWTQSFQGKSGYYYQKTS